VFRSIKIACPPRVTPREEMDSAVSSGPCANRSISGKSENDFRGDRQNCVSAREAAFGVYSLQRAEEFGFLPLRRRIAMKTTFRCRAATMAARIFCLLGLVFASADSPRSLVPAAISLSPGSHSRGGTRCLLSSLLELEVYALLRPTGRPSVQLFLLLFFRFVSVRVVRDKSGLPG